MKVVLLDLSSIAHPIWHVSGNDPDPDHVSTATIARVRQIAADYGRAVVCCDSRKSFRREMCPDYKANREAKPESLFYQIDRAKQVLRDDGYPVLESDGFEADDVIATCVRLLSPVEELEEIVVASSDKDLAQLVRGVDPDGRAPSVRVLALSNNELRGVVEVRAKFGVGPSLVGDWLALVGDASDNIKGAPGIGDKKATALLSKFGSLVGVFGAVEGSTPEAWAARFNGSPEGRLIGGPAVFASLKENGSQVALARKLVELRTDVPITLEAILEKRAPKPLASIDDDEAEDPFARSDATYAEKPPHNGETLRGKWEFEQFERAMQQPEPEHETETAMQTQQIVDQQTGEVIEQQVQVQTAPTPQTNGNGKAAPAPEFARLLQQPTQWEKALEPSGPGEAIKIAGRLFNSRMFAGYGNEDAVLSAILLGRELGLGAMGSLRGIHNVEGRHSLSADLMVALVLRSGKCEYFDPVELTAGKAVYKTKRVGREEFRMTFTLDEAEQAGLVKDKSGWKKWPIDMCKARCIARIARAIYPDVCFGLYTPEEPPEELKEGV
jgi:5'-3' exonuclease